MCAAVKSPPRFQLVSNWEKLPSGQAHPDVADVAIDSRDRVYLLARHPSRVLVYERNGTFSGSFAEGVIGRPHGISVGPDDTVYLVDQGDCVVRKFSTEGVPLGVIGTPGQPSDTGMDWALARRPEGSRQQNMMEAMRGIVGGPPFNNPTKLAVGPNGDLFVSDGYGNARVHRLAPDGRLLKSWGRPGTGPGEFRLPHYVCVTSDERVIVADRENDRLQVFTLDGEFLAAWEDVRRPTAVAQTRDGHFLVAGIAWPVGHVSWRLGEITTPVRACISVLDADGRVLERLGSDGNPCAEGNFFAPHGLALDSRGDLYVVEATFQAMTGGVFVGELGELREQCHTVQKFARQVA